MLYVCGARIFNPYFMPGFQSFLMHRKPRELLHCILAITAAVLRFFYSWTSKDSLSLKFWFLRIWLGVMPSESVFEHCTSYSKHTVAFFQKTIKLRYVFPFLPGDSLSWLRPSWVVPQVLNRPVRGQCLRWWWGDWQGPGALNHPHCQRIALPSTCRTRAPLVRIYLGSCGNLCGKVQVSLGLKGFHASRRNHHDPVKDTAVTGFKHTWSSNFPGRWWKLCHSERTCQMAGGYGCSTTGKGPLE